MNACIVVVLLHKMLIKKPIQKRGGHGSALGTANRYRLDSVVVKLLLGQDFSNLSRQAPRPNQLPVQRILG
jgi:hypothetical protein